MAVYSKDTIFKLKALGTYQLVYATTGLALTLWLLQQGNLKFHMVMAVFILVTGMYLFGVYCGILCFQADKKCPQYSSINQYLQLFGFSIMGYGFTYVAGLSLNLGFDLTNTFIIRLKMQLFSIWHIEFDNHSDVILLNLNIAALLVIIIIERMKKVMRKEEEAELLTIEGEQTLSKR